MNVLSWKLRRRVRVQAQTINPNGQQQKPQSVASVYECHTIWPHLVSWATGNWTYAVGSPLSIYLIIALACDTGFITINNNNNNGVFIVIFGMLQVAAY